MADEKLRVFSCVVLCRLRLCTNGRGYADEKIGYVGIPVYTKHLPQRRTAHSDAKNGPEGPIEIFRKHRFRWALLRSIRRSCRIVVLHHTLLSKLKRNMFGVLTINTKNLLDLCFGFRILT